VDLQVTQVLQALQAEVALWVLQALQAEMALWVLQALKVLMVLQAPQVP